MSITLSSISVAIIAFADANEWSQIYGLMMMPVAIAFCVYSLYMYMKRATMIRGRHPGPCKSLIQHLGVCAWLLWCVSRRLTSAPPPCLFPPLFSPADEDKTGPVVLSALLGLAIIVNFAVNLLGTKPTKA